MSGQDLNNTSLRNATALAIDQKSINGVDTYFSKDATINISGTATPPGTVKATFQADIDASKALDSALADVKAKRATQKQARANARAMRAGLKRYIQGNFGGTTLVAMMEAFGFAEPKTPKKTAASKAQAVVQAQATREARHTMGSKQRKAIKGVVAKPSTPVTSPGGSTPVTSPVASTPVTALVGVSKPASS